MTSRNPVQAFYEDNPRMVSSPFGGIDGISADRLRAVLDDAGVPLEGARVLDVGCGRGYAREVVAAAGGHYCGADFVVSRGGFPLAQADAAHLPFADAAFDVVFCIDASEHFPDPDAAAREFFRVLRPGGGFFLSAPNYGNVAGMVKWWMERFGGYEANSWAPFGRWQPQELEQPLTPAFVRRAYRRAGFIEGHCAGYAPETLLGLLPWCDHPAAPDAIRFRLQRIFARIGPALVGAWPGSSLHLFWRFDKPAAGV